MAGFVFENPKDVGVVGAARVHKYAIPSFGSVTKIPK